MAVKIKEKSIKDCLECPFRDSSGAFTPGGARPICGHENAGVSNKVSSIGNGRHWKYRILETYPEIPNWCKLRSLRTTVDAKEAEESYQRRYSSYEFMNPHSEKKEVQAGEKLWPEEEKIPGTASDNMTETKSIKENRETMEEKKAVREKAKRLMEITLQMKTLDLEQKQLKKELLDDGVNEYFPEEQMKVFVKPGSKKSVIDPEIVFKQLGKKTFLEVCSVTEKALKSIPDETKGLKVLAEAKKPAGVGNPTVGVSAMTKKELEEHCE